MLLLELLGGSTSIGDVRAFISTSPPSAAAAIFHASFEAGRRKSEAEKKQTASTAPHGIVVDPVAAAVAATTTTIQQTNAHTPQLPAVGFAVMCAEKLKSESCDNIGADLVMHTLTTKQQ